MTHCRRIFKNSCYRKHLHLELLRNRNIKKIQPEGNGKARRKEPEKIGPMASKVTKAKGKIKHQTMLEMLQTPFRLAHAYVETLVKSIKLTRTSSVAQSNHQNRPKNNSPRKFPPPGGGTKWPLSLHFSRGQKKAV
jgi:hypothetical protein